MTSPRLLGFLLTVVVKFVLLKDAQGTADGPLGMSNGAIKDWQISASSTYPSKWDPTCHSRHSRIYEPNGKAWCAKHRSDSEWLQIDLGVAAKISGVIVQGRSGKREWVTKFMVSYSTDAFQWQYITDKYGNQKLFQGNFDDHTLKHNYFDAAINARFIKFHTIQWHKHPSLRVEIMGCQECKQLLGMPPYGKMRASSVLPIRNQLSCQESDGFILSDKSWCPRRRVSDDQWLEIDIGHPTLVTALVTKGKGDTKKEHWVTKYKVAFSNDSVLWSYYKDANHLEPKTFGGNADKQMERTHYLNNPFRARFIRFYPTEWHGMISMRAGVYGCPYTGQCLPGYFRVNENSNCVENLVYQKEIWTNERKSLQPQNWFNRNSIKARRYASLVKNQHVSAAVDGNDSNELDKCTIINNFYTKRPTLVINIGRLATVGGIVIKTWQGNGQSVNFPYRDYMYGLDKLSVHVEKYPINVNYEDQIQFPLAINQGSNFSHLHNMNMSDQTSNLNKIINTISISHKQNNGYSKSKRRIGGGGGYMSHRRLRAEKPRTRLNEENECNFVTRNNYALFTSSIHLECNKPLVGRYIYIQMNGRNNRWSRLFSAVFCEIQAYEV